MSDLPPAAAVEVPAPRAKPAPKPKPARAPQQSKNLRGRPTDPLPTRVSKTLAFLLRHGAEKESLAIRPDGYLLVDELLAHPSLKLNKVDFAQLESIVAADAKSRYSLSQLAPPAAPPVGGSPAAPADGDSGLLVWYIRANQGHSLELAGVEQAMRRVETIEQAGLAVHGTYEKHWDSILDGGLKKMTRQHIHLALALPPARSVASTSADASAAEHEPAQDAGKVVSGIRPSADLYIYLDVPLLFSEDVPLFLSDNNVLLSPGDPSTPGALGRRFFLRAVRRSGEVLWEREAGGVTGP